jgi:hypothetical protein
MSFRPKNPRIRLVHDNASAKADRPLYAGKIIVKRLGHYSDTPHEISLPLVAWLAPKGEK